MQSKSKQDRPRTFAHRAGAFVILNVTVWTWLLAGVAQVWWVQLLVWVGGGVATWGWYRVIGRGQEREFRRKHGICVGCGYDLRESAASCPECGTTVPAGHRTEGDVARDLTRVE